MGKTPSARPSTSPSFGEIPPTTVAQRAAPLGWWTVEQETRTAQGRARQRRPDWGATSMSQVVARRNALPVARPSGGIAPPWGQWPPSPWYNEPCKTLNALQHGAHTKRTGGQGTMRTLTRAPPRTTLEIPPFLKAFPRLPLHQVATQKVPTSRAHQLPPPLPLSTLGCLSSGRRGGPGSSRCATRMLMATGEANQVNPNLGALAARETGAEVLLCARSLIGLPQVEDAGIEILLPDAYGCRAVRRHIRQHQEQQPQGQAWGANPPTIIGLDVSSSQAATLLRNVDQEGVPARILLLGAYGTVAPGGPDPADLAAAALGMWGSRVDRLATHVVAAGMSQRHAQGPFPRSQTIALN